MNVNKKLIVAVIASALSLPAFAWDNSIEAKSTIQMAELMRGQRQVLKNFVIIHTNAVCRDKRGGSGSYRWKTTAKDGVIRAQRDGSPDSYKFAGRSSMGGRDYNAGEKWTTEGAAWLGDSCIVTKVSGAGTNSWDYADDFEVWAVAGGIEMNGSLMGTGINDGYQLGDKGFVPLTMTWEEAHEFVNKFAEGQHKGDF